MSSCKNASQETTFHFVMKTNQRQITHKLLSEHFHTALIKHLMHAMQEPISAIRHNVLDAQQSPTRHSVPTLISTKAYTQ